MREQIEAAFDDRELLKQEEHRQAVFDTIAALDSGELRVAEKEDGEWRSNAWVMKAISLYFTVAQMQTIYAGPFEYHDKIPTKKNLSAAGCAWSRRARCATAPLSSRASSSCRAT